MEIPNELANSLPSFRKASVIEMHERSRGRLSNLYVAPQLRGRHGFDMGRETFGACRGVEFLLNPATKVIVANDDNYALAA